VVGFIFIFKQQHSDDTKKKPTKRNLIPELKLEDLTLTYLQTPTWIKAQTRWSNQARIITKTKKKEKQIKLDQTRWS